MSDERRKTGRPSIGQPEMVWGRVSVECRRTVDELAETRGVPKARVVAALVQYGLEHLDEVPIPTKHPQQEELPLTKAS